MTVSVRHQRQRFITTQLPQRNLSILEIGAFDGPTWISEEGPKNVRYLDWYSVEELMEMHRDKPNRNWARAVRVDYVVKDKHFSRRVPERFDLVLANHVIEHIADPITWLNEVAAVTVPGGYLCMALPDRRYTFDYIRPESTVVDMVRAYEANLVQPDYWQSLASIYLYRPIKSADCWPGPPAKEKVRHRRFDLRQAMAHARRAETEYLDVHCYVFTQDTFPSLLSDLYEAELIPWQIVATRGVQEGGNEFIVLLAKDDEGP